MLDLVIFPARGRLSELIEHLILAPTLLAAPSGNIRSTQFIVNERILRVELRRDLQIVHRLLDYCLLK